MSGGNLSRGFTNSTMEGLQEVISARRTESLDAPNIIKLIDVTTENIFGRVNVVNLMYEHNKTFNEFDLAILHQSIQATLIYLFEASFELLTL